MNSKNLIPEKLNKKILDDIRSKINPSIKNIFLKLFLIHVLVAAITLSICPQLGVSSFNTGLDLSHKFLIFGTWGCELAFGFFFTSASVITALFILSRDEIRVIKYNEFYLSLAIILLSIGFLLIFNSQLFVEFSILWLVGTFLGIITPIEVGIRLLKYI